MVSRLPSLTVFFPAYNDWGTIASMVITAAPMVRELADDYEIIVVNDGSSDCTPDILDELETLYPYFRAIHHDANRGYGGALRSGFAAATKEFIFYTDGDAQYDMREIKILMTHMADNVDVVNGYKISRSDPIHRKFLGRVYHWTAKIMFSLKLRDVDCDCRLIRRRVFDKVRLESNSGVICVEMMKKIQDHGFTIVQAPVHHYHRLHGKSQFFNYKRVFRVGIGLIRMWWKLVIKKEHLGSDKFEMTND